MSKITITLPYPPSINHYYYKGRILTKRAREYRQDVIMSAIVGIDLQCLMLKGPLAMSMLAHPPDRRHRDLDNILKPIKDAMQAACVYENDRQIIEYREPFKWGEVVKGGKIVITLEELTKGKL